MSKGNLRFDGATYDEQFDCERLTGQMYRVYAAMRDGQYRTLSEIAAITGDGEVSISAQLRNLRKPRFGAYQVDRRSRGEREHGLFEYRLVAGNQ